MGGAFRWAPTAGALALAGSLAVPASAQTQPTILSNTPAIGATGVPVSSSVVFYFSTNMNTTLTRAQFMNGSIPPPNNIAVTTSWNVEGTQLTNSPTPVFPAGKAILWFMSGIDAWGRPLMGTVNGGFLTASGGTVTLLSVSPANQAVNVPTNASVQFAFSAAMDTNATTAQFSESATPTEPLPIIASWTPDKSILTCAPAPSFPPGKIIFWNLQGQGVAGESFAGAGGGFTTAGSPIETNSSFTAILSRGEVAEQIEETLFHIEGQEFCALADAVPSQGIGFAAPAQMTNSLSRAGTPKAIEFTESDRQPTRFATNFAAGAYQLLVTATSAVSPATIALTDGLLPPPARALNWPAHAVIGQPLALSWTLETGGATVDYVRLRIAQNGRVVFATPLPDSPGALTSSSNRVMVPADVFAGAGRAEVRLTAFTFTALETNAVPGLTLHAARHRTTSFGLAVVDGATPPPTLRTTQLAGFAVGEPLLYPLRVTNGARPLRFTLASGSLPPGVELQTDGALSGNPGTEGTFDVALRVSDVLNQSTTQSVRIVTSVLPAPVQLSIENIARGAGATIQFDVVGAAGTDCHVDRSTNLVNWSHHLTANAPTGRITLQAPISSETAFLRLRGAGTPPPPHPLKVSPVLNPDVTASASFGLFGGSMSLTNAANYVFTLTVPLGALDGDEIITMTEVSQIGGLPLSGGMSAAVDLQPEGLFLNIPARLDITSPTDTDPKTVFGFGSMGDGSEFALNYSLITNRTVSLYLRHFSMAGTGTGNSSDGQSQSQNPPSDPWTDAKQETERMRQECLQSDCDTSDLAKKMLDYYLVIADQVVTPKLQIAAQSAEDGVVDGALTAYNTWLREIQLLGISDDPLGQGQEQPGGLGDRLRRMTSLASTAISKGMTKACQECMSHDVGRMQRMLTLEGYAQALGWTHEQELLKCFDQCMVFEMKIDSEILVETSEGILLTHTKSTVKLNIIQQEQWILHGTASYEGTAEWKPTSVQEFDNPCPISSSPASGTADLRKVDMNFFKKKIVNVPGSDPIVTYVFSPHLEVYLRASVSSIPTEGRTAQCEDSPPFEVGDLYGPTFFAKHEDEIVTPESGSAEEAWLGGPALRITGFQQGSGDVIFTKEYSRSEAHATEFTLIELIHTPK